jgi:hypothetical protein
MAEAKEAASDPKGKKAEGKKGKNAEGKKTKHDPRMVKSIARAVSGLGKEEWNKLGKESQKAHMKTAKKVLLVQRKISAKPAKPRGSKGEASAGAGQD